MQMCKPQSAFARSRQQLARRGPPFAPLMAERVRKVLGRVSFEAPGLGGAAGFMAPIARWPTCRLLSRTRGGREGLW